MVSIAIYSAILNSTPMTKEGHGSRHPNSCNVYGCELNGGKEKHKIELKDWNRMINQRYKEITKEEL